VYGVKLTSDGRWSARFTLALDGEGHFLGGLCHICRCHATQQHCVVKTHSAAPACVTVACDTLCRGIP
jgi:hypothetical protein